jgi:DNA modification methylase
MTWRIENADCIAAMREMDEASVDAIVTDPPYGIGFMGKEWDAPTIARAAADDAATRKSLGPESASRPGRALPRSSSAFGSPAHYAGPVRAGAEWQAWCLIWATEALRVLKPGGHLLAFGGTRTFHRLACAVEDAGFEIRDSLIWLYGSGFPKSLDVSKAIDRAAGAEREVVGTKEITYDGANRNPAKHSNPAADSEIGEWGLTSTPHGQPLAAPATPEAEKWNGWGTALKPGHEPIVMARKPLIGTVSRNVLEHGTGGLNIDGCRIEGAKASGSGQPPLQFGGQNHRPFHDTAEPREFDTTQGRWPANVLLDEAAAAELDRQSGELTSGTFTRRKTRYKGDDGNKFTGATDDHELTGHTGGDTGGASRFYYCAKASRGERNAGLDGFPSTKSADDGYGSIQEPNLDRAAPRENWEPHRTANHHPTVKPIALMRWLCRLVTPPDGLILDPFTGSGTTGCAAVLEDFNFIGIEREAEYVELAKARIDYWASQPKQLGLLDAA